MLGTRIAMLRKNQGMSQQELAERLGLSASAVGMYEQGRREPPCQILVALAKLFGVSTDFLLTGDLSAAEDRKIMKEATEKLQTKLFFREADGALRPLSSPELALILAALLDG